MKKKQKQKFKIPRTVEGTIFEIAFVVLAVVVWVLIIVMLRHSPDTVATHFDIAGRPDDYGSKLHILFPCIMTSVMGGCMLLGAYFPHTVNLPVMIENLRQALLVTRMMRILALVFLLLTIAMAYTSLSAAHTGLPIILTVAAILSIVGFFTVFIYKSK
jgi:uncharacterized membrane protein